MQLIEKGCVICDQAIKFEAEAVECQSCLGCFHKACLDSSGICPNCGVGYASQVKMLASDAGANRQSAQLWGRNALLGICLFMLGMRCLPLAFALYGGVIQAQDLLVLSLFLGLMLALFLGQSWARIITGISALIGGLAWAKVAWTGLSTSGLDLALIPIGIVTLYMLCTWGLLSSERVQLFVASRRQKAIKD